MYSYLNWCSWKTSYNLWMTGEWMNEWMNGGMNEWGGLFSCLCHVFEVCAEGSYLSIWRGNHVVVDAFSQRAVTCRTNLSIKGTRAHKYHQRGVRAELQSPSSFLPFASGTRATVCAWNRSRNGPFGVPRSCYHVHVLGCSGGISLVCGLLLGWKCLSVYYRWFME